MIDETKEDEIVGLREGEQEERAPARLVTAEMIEKTNLGAVLAAVADRDDYAVQTQLRASGKVATEAGDVDRADALELFASIMSIAIRPDDEANPFTAKIVMDGRRSMIPDDIVGEQSAILAEIVETLPNPHLRAKVGDIVFYNSRKHWQAAATAIDAYCQIARGRLDDTIEPRPSRPADSISDVIEPLARATALTRLTKKRGDIPVLVRQTLQACYDAALAGCHYVVFVKIAELGIWHGILEASQVARDTEELARNAPPET